MTTTTWELRWIAAGLPPLASVWWSMPSGSPPSSVVEDDDVYLLTRSTRINLKLRRRTNTCKLKQLTRRSARGFERWRTEFDEPLPVGRAVAERVVILLAAPTVVVPLAAAATTEEALEVIATVYEPGRIVEAHKRRRLYRSGLGLVDDVRFHVCGSAFRSIGFEGPTERAAGEFLSELAPDRLGTPRNYVQFLHQHGQTCRLQRCNRRGGGRRSP